MAKHKRLRVLAGFSASTQKQNGSVNKKAITNARLGHKAAGVADVENSAGILQGAVVFCGAMCHIQKLPIPKCTPTIMAGWRVLGFSFAGAINRNA